MMGQGVRGESDVGNYINRKNNETNTSHHNHYHENTETNTSHHSYYHEAVRQGDAGTVFIWPLTGPTATEKSLTPAL